jgi:para-nitrobenzyl esterase
MKRIGLLLVLGGVLAVIAQPSAMIPAQVRIDTGLLSGVAGVLQPTVRAFKGIPFAAPPLGDLRWKAPQPAAKWDGVREADEFGAPCAAGRPPAGRGGRGPAAPGAAPANPQVSAGIVLPPREPARAEDCLYANVWTSATSANDKRPVMVWIYGGGFSGGSGGLTWYDGEALAAKGPVIVTVQLPPRLARLLRPSRSGEGGRPSRLGQLRDDGRHRDAAVGKAQHRGVRRRSDQGDRGRRVGRRHHGGRTRRLAAGQGAVRAAIAQSGGWMGLQMGRMRPASAAEADGVAAMKTLGVSTIAELRAKPLNQLTIQGQSGLVIDGYLIPEDLSLTFQAGKQNAVDVLTGSNADEANFGICPGAGLNGRAGGTPMTAANLAPRLNGASAPRRPMPS